MRIRALVLTLVVCLGLCHTELENGSIKAACATLLESFPGNVYFPNSTYYNLSNIYWSARQSALHPACFVTPRSTLNVSHIMKTLTSLDAPFTVKGGGHTAFPGSSNTQGGVTIDLVHLNDITISNDKSIVSVGPGNRWINVSLALDPLGLAVVAGRAASVGVSGFTLGGGQSYFSGLHGWGCDNVRNFEVVLSSGEIVNASATTNADLYWALRGSGGSNWGIVTRFDLMAFRQGDLWTRSVMYNGKVANETLLPIIKGLAMNGLKNDPGAHTYFVQTYDQASQSWLFLASLFHDTPPKTNTTPAVFEEFNIVPGPVRNTTLVANVSAISRLIDEPVGIRATWWDTTVAVTSVELFKEIDAMYTDWVSGLMTAVGAKQLAPFLVYQPITDNILKEMQKNGGNCLGLYPQDGPLMMIQVSARWADAEIDGLIEASIKDFVANVERRASERKLLRGYVYINYAGSSQDVLRRYGKENYDRLKSIAKKWDPEGLLQRLWTGYFQLH
ncbi:hypothetical protein QQS21_012580 [Conoideocrella luteorostrata]|uniref:FAD-binding PCMH-type domain-containing protein n=1 Tax=Conoideocrella luteorostrata TaxID=1105319 RepID=A0AAJ0CB80_9HYPO|nr:hypothetical protein QQS21_012580 [Conoideocrella luteorostrata]